MSDIQFVDGMKVSRPEKAPDYVLAKLGLKREELIAWLERQAGEWVNVELKRSKNGKCYAALDTWRPEGQREAPRVQDQPRDFIDDELPPF